MATFLGGRGPWVIVKPNKLIASKYSRFVSLADYTKIPNFLYFLTNINSIKQNDLSVFLALLFSDPRNDEDE